jgi:predicted DNA-binding transcriptional regulator YafY
VVIRLAERLVPAIPEIFGRRVTVQRLDSGAIVRVQVTHRQALVAAVLPYGAAAEVLAPQSLRADVRRIYERLAQRYSDEPDAPQLHIPAANERIADEPCREVLG